MLILELYYKDILELLYDSIVISSYNDQQVFTNFSPPYDSFHREISIQMKNKVTKYSGDPYSEILILEPYL